MSPSINILEHGKIMNGRVNSFEIYDKSLPGIMLTSYVEKIIVVFNDHIYIRSFIVLFGFLDDFK